MRNSFNRSWVRGCNMSRGNKKPTIRQLDEKISVMVSRVDGFLNMIAQELEKHNTLILKILQRDGLIHEQECNHCGGIVRTPMLDGIEPVELCPYCEQPMDNTEQTTLPLAEEE